MVAAARERADEAHPEDQPANYQGDASGEEREKKA
jgi:hypothetical protein